MEKTYGVKSWSSPADFLEQMAKQTGKLLKGGEPDVRNVAVMVLNDWQRGKLPYFVAPPQREDKEKEEEEEKGEDEDKEEEEEEEKMEEEEDEDEKDE